MSEVNFNHIDRAAGTTNGEAKSPPAEPRNGSTVDTNRIFGTSPTEKNGHTHTGRINGHANGHTHNSVETSPGISLSSEKINRVAWPNGYRPSDPNKPLEFGLFDKILQTTGYFFQRIIDAIKPFNIYKSDPWITIPNVGQTPEDPRGNQDILRGIQSAEIIRPSYISASSTSRDAKIHAKYAGGLTIPPRREVKLLIKEIKKFRAAIAPFTFPDKNNRIYYNRFDQYGRLLADPKPFLPPDVINKDGSFIRFPSYVTTTQIFDNPQLSLARAKSGQISPRFKARVRSYAWDGFGPVPDVFIETKRKTLTQDIIKTRTQISAADWVRLTPLLFQLGKSYRPGMEENLDNVPLDLKDLKQKTVSDFDNKYVPQFNSEFEAYNFYYFLYLVKHLGLMPVLTIAYTRESLFVSDHEIAAGDQAPINHSDVLLHPARSRSYQRITIDRNVMSMTNYEPGATEQSIKDGTSFMYRFPTLAETEGYFAACGENRGPGGFKSDYSRLWRPVPTSRLKEGRDWSGNFTLNESCYIVELKACGDAVPVAFTEILDPFVTSHATFDYVDGGYCKYSEALGTSSSDGTYDEDVPNEIGQVLTTEGKHCTSPYDLAYTYPREMLYSKRRHYEKRYKRLEILAPALSAA